MNLTPELSQMIIKALGLQGRHITKMILTIESGKVPTLELTEQLLSSNTIKVNENTFEIVERKGEGL